jgi:hypothetical protein
MRWVVDPSAITAANTLYFEYGGQNGTPPTWTGRGAPSSETTTTTTAPPAALPVAGPSMDKNMSITQPDDELEGSSGSTTMEDVTE